MYRLRMAKTIIHYIIYRIVVSAEDDLEVVYSTFHRKIHLVENLPPICLNKGIEA